MSPSTAYDTNTYSDSQLGGAQGSHFYSHARCRTCLSHTLGRKTEHCGRRSHEAAAHTSTASQAHRDASDSEYLRSEHRKMQRYLSKRIHNHASLIYWGHEKVFLAFVATLPSRLWFPKVQTGSGGRNCGVDRRFEAIPGHKY